MLKKNTLLLLRIFTSLAIIGFLVSILRDNLVEHLSNLADKLKNGVIELIIIAGLLLVAPTLLRWITCWKFHFESRLDKVSEQRIETLRQLFLTIGNVAVVLTAVLLFLGIFSIDMKPLLAGMGIMGFALGFGFQSTVKDFIAGILILAENQYAIGEYVKIGEFKGRVSKISLRLTVLAGEDGEITIPNGSVAGSGIINYSRKAA